MKKQYFLIALLLLFSAFIYAGFRTENTVFNILLSKMFSPESILNLKETLKNSILDNETIIYSLPGGLWVYCATLLGKELKLQLLSKKINLGYSPITFALTLELLQYFQIINGRFDVIDVIFYLLFALGAMLGFRKNVFQVQFFKPINTQSILFSTIFLSVFLAHVTY